MESVKSQFLTELEKLEKLTAFFNIEPELLKVRESDVSQLNEFVENFAQFYSQKRIFNYNSLIISLYGYFEKFIENLLIEYVDNINVYFKNYDSIPDVVTKNHLKLSLSLLEKVQSPRYNGPLNKENIIRNLHDSINVNENYQLNKEAFSQHTANFRVQVIDEVFARIGIEQISQQVIKVKIFNSYLERKYGTTELQALEKDDVHSLLNELAERRNEVAHGVPTEILSNSIFLDYIKYFKCFSISITEVVTKHLYSCNLKENGVLIGGLTNCYKGGTVLCFHTNNKKITKGDVLFGVNGSSIVKSTIRNIQLDGVDIEYTDETKDYEIGVLIDNPFKANFEVYKITQHNTLYK